MVREGERGGTPVSTVARERRRRLLKRHNTCSRTARAAVVGFADSGFYLDVNNYSSYKKFVVEADGQNASGLLCAIAIRTRHL